MKDYEVNTVSGLVKKLRECEEQCNNPLYDAKMKCIANLMSTAAGAIEVLSEKLMMESMEREAKHCHDEWIYCGDGKNLPEEHDSIFAKIKGTGKWNGSMFEKLSDDVNVTVEFEDGKRKTMTLRTIDGKWEVGRILKPKVIAWRPLPDMYYEDMNVVDGAGGKP